MANLLDNDVMSLLAFIDEFSAQPADPTTPRGTKDSSSGHESTSSSDGRAEENESGKSSSSSPALASSNTNNGRKKRNPSSSSTELQRRKRAEIKALREQVEELEAHAAKLKYQRPDHAQIMTGAKRKSEAATSKWQEMAMVQSRERQRSELTNRRLKTIFSNQQQLQSGLRKLLNKRMALQGVDLVFGNGQIHRPPVTSLDCSPAVINKLAQEVSALYLRLAPFEMPSLPSTLSCTTTFHPNHKHGRTVEVVTTTPMGCSMEDSARILWHKMGTSKCPLPDKSYYFNRSTGHESYERYYQMLVRDITSNVQINGLQFMRRYVETDRVVIVRANLVLLPTDGLRFRDHGITTVSRVRTRVGEASLVESRYQAHALVDEALDVAPADLSAAQQLMLHKLSSCNRLFDQGMQSLLITEAMSGSGQQVSF